MLFRAEARNNIEPFILQFVQRASDPSRSFVQDMSVDHRRAHIGVAEQLLNGANIVARFEQVCRERVAKGMSCRSFVDPRGLDCALDLSTDSSFVEVVAKESSFGPARILR